MDYLIFQNSEKILHYGIIFCFLGFCLITKSQPLRKALVVASIFLIFINFRYHPPETDVKHILSYSSIVEQNWNNLLTSFVFQREFVFWWSHALAQGISPGLLGLFILDFLFLSTLFYLVRNIRLDSDKMILICAFLISGFFIIQANNGLRQFYSTLFCGLLLAHGSRYAFLSAFIHNIGVIGLGYFARKYKLFAVLGAVLIFLLTQFDGDFIRKSVGTKITGYDLKWLYILAMSFFLLLSTQLTKSKEKDIIQFYLIFGISATTLLVGTVSERLGMFVISINCLVLIFSSKPLHELINRYYLYIFCLFLISTTFIPSVQRFLY